MENIKEHRVLIVDDQPENIDILKALLKSEYKIVTAVNGAKALKIAASSSQPDLILLDIIMPGMDGYEVCEKLKNDPATKNIPVIFITAKDQTEDETRGLLEGAVDYITKPFTAEIVKARVSTHIELKKYRDHMERMVEKRTAALNLANINLKKEMEKRARLELERQDIQNKVMIQDKLATLGQVATGVAHELNQPLTYINTIIRTTIERLAKNKIDRDKLTEKFERAAHQTDRILDIITHLRVVGRTGDTKRQEVNLADVLSDSLILMNEKMKLRNITLTADIAEKMPTIIGIHNKLEQVFINLTTNAIDALEKEEDGEIKIKMRPAGDKAIITFSDNGSGMPPEIREKIFEPFFTTKESGKGTGLGMAIINDIVTDHNGSISCESEEGQGTKFTITLPLR